MPTIVALRNAVVIDAGAAYFSDLWLLCYLLALFCSSIGNVAGFFHDSEKMLCFIFKAKENYL